ncbi:MAG: tetratricopeptide repeat protein, partial [Nitrospirae bacterium]|nr:tetratricopeptide repeat protein [Nitrospirota bacterium]
MLVIGKSTGKQFLVLSVVAAIYVTAGFAIYSNVLLHGKFLFDDFEYVYGNPLIQSLSLFKDMTDPRHVGYLSFALNYAVHGNTPFGFHLVNLVIHIINSILVFSLTKIIYALLAAEKGSASEGDTTAMLAGLLFLVHPVATQSVSYVTQRFTSLSTLFYIAGVFFYLKARTQLEHTRGRAGTYALYIFSVAGTVLAMKTKEIAFTAPFVIGILEFLLFRNSVLSKRRFICLIPFAATLIIVPLSLFGPEWGLIGGGTGVDEITRRDKLYDLYERSAYEYLLTQFRVIVTYIRLLVLPVHQQVIYDFRVSHSLFEPKVILSFALLLLIAYSGLRLWRKEDPDKKASAGNKLASLGIMWFFIALSIESSVIPIKDIIFEHRTYLPSVGFFAASSVLLLRLLNKAGKGWSDRIKISVLAVIVIMPLSVSTYLRNEIWTDELKFWDDVVRKTGKAIGYNNRGNAYAKAGKYELAVEDLDKAISMFPKNISEMMAWENADFTPANMSKTYMNRGDILYFLGEIEKAQADFNRARQVMVMPLDEDKTLKMADDYSRRGAYSHAIEEYSKVLAWEPDNANALNDRGNSYSRSGKYREAIE